jgi:hypothetical protein
MKCVIMTVKVDIFKSEKFLLYLIQKTEKHWVMQVKRGLDSNRVFGSRRKLMTLNILVKYSFLNNRNV